MKRLIFILAIGICLNGFGQEINLVDHLNSNKITLVNRQISEFEDNGIELDAKEGDGLAILEFVDFKTGIVELEIKGENAPGRSFVGLAFNIKNDSTYEAVYFRPFNFPAEDLSRRSHMVQYISHPTFTWHKLRKERTNEFEGELKTPPSPDDWFIAKIKITDDKMTVFLNEENYPVLEVNRLTETNSSKIALWTGNGSSGRFRNIVLTKE